MIRCADTSFDSWKTQARPGYFGTRRNKILKRYEKEYGTGNFRLCWRVNGSFRPFDAAIMLYEDAYFEFLRDNEKLFQRLITTGADVYDNALSNVKSGFNYFKQENHSNHYQDIAIRRVVVRLGKSFSGRKLIQIRQSSSSNVGRALSPGRVPFHLPHLIQKPSIKGWWAKGTIEDFWQSNKMLQVYEHKNRNQKSQKTIAR